MSAQDSAFAYQQSSAFGASAVGQVVVLYDRILRDLHHALAAIDTRDIERRVAAINHALTVIGELQGVLDFERGGDAARNLNNFYTVTRGMITAASVSCSPQDLKELIALFTRVRAAWSKAERAIPPEEPSQRLRISSQPQSGSATDTSTPPDHSSGSTSGGWNA